MRHPKGKKYCSTEGELHQYCLSLKWRACPKCGRIGFLIGHGFLRGYSGTGSGVIIRGRRFYCSNRYRKTGCGKTCSVLFSQMLRGFVVSAHILWSLLQGMEAGLSANAAWMALESDFCVESGHRLIRRLKASQPRLRTLLCQIRPPPYCKMINPLLQLAAHFRECFPLSSCPFSQFQEHFQESLLR